MEPSVRVIQQAFAAAQAGRESSDRGYAEAGRIYKATGGVLDAAIVNAATEADAAKHTLLYNSANDFQNEYNNEALRVAERALRALKHIRDVESWKHTMSGTPPYWPG